MILIFKRIVCVTTFAMLLSGCMKTPAYLECKREEFKEGDLAYLSRDFVGGGSVCLYIEDAIDMAIARNLELQYKMRQVEIEEEALTGARLKMIPRLLAEDTSSYRNKNTGAFSESLVPGIPPAPASVSTQQKQRFWSLTLTWNLLDFGVSYYRARQEANKVLVQAFEYERAKQNLILIVVRQFWKLAAEQKTYEQVLELLPEIDCLVERLNTNAKNGTISCVQAARINGQLIEAKIRMEENIKEYLQVRAEFKNTLGLLPEVEICLEGVEEILPNRICLDPEELEEIALMNRPELYGYDLQEASWADEVRASFLQFFPELAPFWSANWDANRFLIFHHWWQAGVRVSWNLLGIPQRVADMEVAQRQKMATRWQRLQQSIGILTQVHLSYLLYQYQYDEYLTARDLRVQRAVLRRNAETLHLLNAQGCQETVLAQVDALLADLNASRSYGELMAALELINNTMGMPLYLKPDDCE